MLRFATLMGGVPGFANPTGPVYEAVAYERLATLCVYPRRSGHRHLAGGGDTAPLLSSLWAFGGFGGDIGGLVSHSPDSSTVADGNLSGKWCWC